MSKFFLGIDAGGSRTRAVLVSSGGELLGVGYGGPANVRTVPFGVAADSIQAATRAAVVPTGATRMAAVCIGSAGLEEPGPEADGRAFLGDVVLSDTVLFDTDAFIAWAGAFALQPGALVIAGTGAIALAVDASGRRRRLGGWGPLFGDEGSAYWIARAAIRAALRMLDGREPRTALLASLLKFAGLSQKVDAQTALALTTWLYTCSAAEIARFSELVAECAEQEDAPSRDILRSAGRELAQLALDTLEELELPRVSVAGSVLAQNARVREAFLAALGGYRDAFCEPAFSPVLGAVLLAMQTSTGPAEKVLEKLARVQV